MRTLAVLFALSGLALAQPGKLSYPRLGPPWPPRTQPSWINQGLVFAGTWEPLPWLYRKNWQDFGNARAGAEAERLYREERSEATVIGLKKLGVNMILTGFHKGFGIENEKATMEEARQLAVLLHKHGMKMGVYVSALLIYEDLYAEFPEARNWHRVRADGSPDTYGDDGFRYRAFLNHPEHLNYIKRVCELAVKAGADLIHFDVMSQPFGNYHPLAERMFRDWLKKKYPAPQEWFFRTGLRNWDFVKIPVYADVSKIEAFDQPIMQEYLHFAAELLGEYAGEMRAFIHGLNPECAVEFNPQGVTGLNRVLLQGVDHAAILPWLDSYWSEGPNNIGYAKNGRMISRIRSYKIGQQYNSQMFAYTGHLPPAGDRGIASQDPRLPLAEAMAFNRQCLGDVGSPLVYKDFPETGRRYLQYFWKNFHLFAKAETAAEVAVLRSFASMAFNSFATHRETILAEEALIQYHVPFDLIDDHNLADLSKYKVIVLANQESLSDRQIAALGEFARKGGGLVTTANTARYNEWRRQREAGGLVALPGGRVAHIPALRPSIPAPAKAPFGASYWAPPANAREFLDALRRVAGKPLQIDITAPRSVAAELYSQPDRKRHVLHLVNYSGAPGAEAEFTWRGAGVKFTVWSPDAADPVELQAERTAGGLRVKLPPVEVYSVVTIQ